MRGPAALRVARSRLIPLGLIPLGAIPLFVAAGCGGEPEATPTPAPTEAPEELVLPDLTELDLPGAITDAVSLALMADLRRPWAAHAATLDLAQEGCPDFYVGDLGELDLDDVDDGYAWSDRCRTGGGLGYSGLMGWRGELSAEGDPASDAGQTTVAERLLEGDAVVDDDDGVLLEFDGQGSDSYYAVEAPGYLRWTYSAQVAATVTGRLPLGDSGFPSGWRQDLYLRYTSGDEDSLEIRGNLYLLDERLDRFDSFAMDFALQGEAGASPDECTLEPSGYIGLRDTNAYWYEVVFQPRDAESDPDVNYENPLSGCDGCGTLYVRGVTVGEVCVDLSPIFATFTQPDLANHLLPVRM